MNILIVDHEKVILDAMGEILEICQRHTVQAAGSGKEALQYIRRKKYDLVVMELRLPPMNGLEVIAKIRKLRPQLPVVVLTSIPCNDALREKLKKLNVQKVFQKPRGVHELLLYLKESKTKESVA